MNASERRSINRANGARSRGPLSEATKAISARNALKHGLRAAKYALPNEDPQEAHDETHRWLAHYRPRTEYQHELVGRIAGACTLQRRCQRAYDATVALQVLNADADLDRAHEAEVDAFKARLVKEPAAAVAGLRRTALGCRWLIGRWQRLRDHLESYGSLAHSDRDEMVRLCGVDLIPDRFPPPESFEIALHCELARPGASAASLYDVPEGLRASYRERWGDPAANRAELRARIDAALVELVEREERLRNGREAIERATAADRALVIADPDQARLWIRYYNESSSTFFRASRELQRALEEDEGGGELAEEARSPNEPNDPIEGLLSDDIDVSCEVSAAVVSECAEAAAGPGKLPGTLLGGEGVTEAMNGPSPNEPNAPAGPRLSIDQIRALAEMAAPLAGTSVTALAARLEALQRPDLSDEQRAQFMEGMERELDALDRVLLRLNGGETVA